MRRLFLGLALVAALTGCAAAARGVPKGFRPETAAAVGARDIWVLGEGNVLARSTDAGARFERVGFPAFATRGTVPTNEFANANDGFAYVPYSPRPLDTTHDGGARWHASLNGRVVGFALGGGYAYASTTHGLERAPIGSDTWTRLTLPAGRVAALGHHVWVLGPPRRKPDSPTIAISTDSGRAFTARRGPCVYDLPGNLVPAGGGVVWAVCPTGMMAGLWVSRNDGRSFAITSFHDPGGTRRPGLTNGAEIFPTSPSDAILAGGAGGPLLETADAGGHWTELPELRRIAQLDWLDCPTRKLCLALVQSSGNNPRATLGRITVEHGSWQTIPIR